jgi:hypothetical protein
MISQGPQDIRFLFDYTRDMGGERESTTRQRMAGKICALCSLPLDPGPWHGGERVCDRCTKRRVYMSFFARQGWVCGFLEEDCKTPVGRGRVFATEDKIRELIARTPTRMDQAAKEALEYAFKLGRGGVWLELTGEQYRKLKQT